MTYEEFKTLAVQYYPDLVCNGDDMQDTSNCIDCKGINSLDVSSAEAYVLANISPIFNCCDLSKATCCPNILEGIKRSIVYLVLIEKMYDPEYEGINVRRMINDFMYKEGLIRFG